MANAGEIAAPCGRLLIGVRSLCMETDRFVSTGPPAGVGRASAPGPDSERARVNRASKVELRTVRSSVSPAVPAAWQQG